MKRTLLAAMLIASMCLVSCDKEKGGAIIENGFVMNVSLGSDSNNSSSKTEVTSGGNTRWSIGDKVTIVDVECSPREFSYASPTAKASAKFTGKLLAGRGTQTYYAYYTPQHSSCVHTDHCVLTYKRKDLNLIQNGEINAAVFGQYCPMVAIPVTFDAEDVSQSKSIQFYHVNSLIEASIASIPTDGRLDNLVFEKVVFEIIATSAEAPFNSEIRIDMSQIEASPVTIPYSEGPENVKTDRMYSSITYKAPTRLGDLIDNGGTSCYGIPLFALPTETPFEFEVNVKFYLDDALVLTLHRPLDGAKTPTATGLNLAGLNIIDFDERHIL